jgi:Overcoming lysogenization defect protein-like, TOPRIM domain
VIPYAPDVPTVVLVEGLSDQRAIEALARRRGRDLAGERVAILPIGGAQAIGGFVERYGPRGRGYRLAGLCDAGEERFFRRALEQGELGRCSTRDDMERLGFFVCDRDLEDELTRALGADAVERVIEAEGETTAFRTFCKQVTKRELSLEQQLHGFMWNRKRRYAPALVEALDPSRVPRVLDRLLEHV